MFQQWCYNDGLGDAAKKAAKKAAAVDAQEAARTAQLAKKEAKKKNAMTLPQMTEAIEADRKLPVMVATTEAQQIANQAYKDELRAAGVAVTAWKQAKKAAAVTGSPPPDPAFFKTVPGALPVKSPALIATKPVTAVLPKIDQTGRMPDSFPATGVVAPGLLAPPQPPAVEVIAKRDEVLKTTQEPPPGQGFDLSAIFGPDGLKLGANTSIPWSYIFIGGAALLLLNSGGRRRR